MEQKIGVYIDTGYGIGEAIDVEAMCTVANDEFNVAICRAEAYWSDPEKLQVIRKDVADEGLTAVVIAGPSRRVLEDVFKFGGVITERANIREHVIWCQPPNDENTQMLAEDYLRMAITKVTKYADRPPYLEETIKSILVVGGGITGLTAALGAADAGYQVYLVEKEPELGGWAAKFPKVFTGNPPYDLLEESPIQEMVAEMVGHPKIKVFTSSRVYSISGAPGMFEAVVRADGAWIEEVEKKERAWFKAQQARQAQAAGGEVAKPAEGSEEQVGAWGMGKEGDLDFEHERVSVGAIVSPRVGANDMPDLQI